jgi:hypothetical protein
VVNLAVFMDLGSSLGGLADLALHLLQLPTTQRKCFFICSVCDLLLLQAFKETLFNSRIFVYIQPLLKGLRGNRFCMLVFFLVSVSLFLTC